MKRFWQEVTVTPVAGGYGLRLDARAVRTPGRAELAVPTLTLAEAMATEWRTVGERFDPRALPLTALANAAIDRIAPDPAAFAATLTRYGESDLLCYRADRPAVLVARQAALWDPLLDWAGKRYDVHFETTAGVVHRPQPPATLTRLTEAVTARTPFELAGLSPLVTIGGSLIAALALLEGAVTVEALWTAVQVDADWQQEQWGNDSLAAATAAVHHAEFTAGARLLALLRI